jgi:hypothetical protein
MKSFYVTLAAGKFFPKNIHQENYHFTHNKKLKKTNTTVQLFVGIVYRKRPLNFPLSNKLSKHFFALRYLLESHEWLSVLEISQPAGDLMS